MCWSADGSLATWAAAMTLAGITHGYDPKLWVFAAIFTHMQLVEYFLWKNLQVPRLNTFWSQIGFLIVLIEPVAAIYLIENESLRNKLLVGYAMYVAVLLSTQKFDFRTVVGGNGHLEWKWIPSLFKLIPWFVFFLAPIWIAGYHEIFIGACLTLLASIYFYGKYGTFSTMWCWIAVSIWVYFFIDKNKIFGTSTT